MRRLLNIVLCGLSLALPIVGDLPNVLGQTDDRLTRGQMRQLRDAVQRCQQRIASGEIDECIVTIPWQNRQVSMDEARRLADELADEACRSCIAENRRQVDICNTFMPPSSQLLRHRECLNDARIKWNDCRAMFECR